MAGSSTNTLLRTLTVAQNICRNAPLTGVGGNPLEPAASIGDWTRNFVLSPPFAWRWNRGVTSFTTLANGTQDYVVNLPSFGWLEKATTNDGTGGQQSIQELKISLLLSEDNAVGLPLYISPRLDDDSGNITFRLSPPPSAVYTVTLAYQKASPNFVNLSDPWNPIPDYLSHIYNLGFLARAYEYFDDPRYAFNFQMFLRQLIAASEGLDDSQKNIYLAQFLDGVREQQNVGMKSQSGNQSRSGQ